VAAIKWRQLQFEPPFLVAGFAEDDETIVDYDKIGLFALPTKSVPEPQG
jgi:hypothetical protein